MRPGKIQLIYLGFFIVGLGYLCQLPTPLRVNWDAVYYLSIAGSFIDGRASFLHGTKSHFPSGYPWIIANLDRMGFGRSLGFVAWNLLMTAIAAALGIRLLQRWLGLPKSIAMLLSLTYLLSWATMRYALIPGSEPTYIAISFLCLLCLTEAEKSSGNWRWQLWILAIFLVPPAMSVRSIGVVLPPAILWTLLVILWRLRKIQTPLRQWIAERWRALVTAAVIVMIAMGALISRLPYFHEDVSRMTKRGVFDEAIFTEKQRCMEATSMLFNIPSKNVLTELHRPEMYIGIPCLALVLFLIARRLRSPTGADVYLALFVGVLLVWPYDMDVRFWVPVQLLIFGIAAKELLQLLDRYSQKLNLIRTATTTWIALFAALGFASLLWNAKLSYSGNQFGELWDLHSFRDTYRVAFHNGLSPDPADVHPDLLAVLKRFGSPYSDPDHH
jgi:hypothetical protein